MKLNTKGFGLVEGLLVFIAVALVAFGGFYVWNESQNDDEDAASEMQTMETNEDEASDSTSGNSEASQAINAGLDSVAPVTQIVVIDELGIEFDSTLESPIVMTPGEFGVYLTTQEFIDLARSRSDYIGTGSLCELQIAALSVYDTPEDVPSDPITSLYQMNFDENGLFKGNSDTLIELNDGRYLAPQRQNQALCYDTVHLEVADSILDQLNDVRSY